ncbi:MAG: DUF371 domain-containing protein [Methanoregula sp.]|jgi:hypothetical protein|nr:DUF371 domain-containing protein [Methanoregula sp.]
MEATEVIRCRGHPLISASHPTTFEVTMEGRLTRKGHCIVGIGADKGALLLSPRFKGVLCHDDASLLTILSCEEFAVAVHSRGSAAMTLNHPTDLVWRKSNFVCGRTIGIYSDQVAVTLPGGLVGLLKAGRPLLVTMVAQRPG